MASIIEENILKQSFELIGDRLGTILLEELTAQKLKQSLPEEVNIYKERTTPIDTSENLLINVLFSGEEIVSRGQKDGMYNCIFFIDIYTTGKASENQSGYSDSTNRLLRYSGLVRYILSHTGYNTLLFDDGLIGNTSVNAINVAEPSMDQDSSFIRMARVSFSCKVLENQQLWQGESVSGGDTSVRIFGNERGYKFQYDNP